MDGAFLSATCGPRVDVIFSFGPFTYDTSYKVTARPKRREAKKKKLISKKMVKIVELSRDRPLHFAHRFIAILKTAAVTAPTATPFAVTLKSTTLCKDIDSVACQQKFARDVAWTVSPQKFPSISQKFPSIDQHRRQRVPQQTDSRIAGDCLDTTVLLLDGAARPIQTPA